MRNFLVMVRATSRHHKGMGDWMYARLVLLLNHHVSLVPRPITMSTKLRWSLLMDVDLLLGTEQALMQFPLIANIDVAVVVNVCCCLRG